MEADFEYDIFLSYSSKDKPAVKELAERLAADGLRVWLDDWVIQPGDSIPLAIEQGLENSRTLVLVMSEHSIGKEASEWVTFERHTALFRDPANKQRRFIPLRLDDSAIMDSLRHFAYVDWREKSDEQYARLLAAFDRTVLSIETLKGESSERLVEAAELLDVYSVSVKSPLDYAFTSSGESFPAAKCVAKDYSPDVNEMTGFVTDSCVIGFDIAALVGNEGVRVDEIVVRIKDYRILPEFRIEGPLPLMRAHVYYVQIDAPNIAGSRSFRSSKIVGHSGEYLLVEKGRPERCYAMIGALTPGIYSFDLGVVVSHRHNTVTRWLTSQTILFYAPRGRKEPAREDLARYILQDSYDILGRAEYIHKLVDVDKQSGFEVARKIIDHQHMYPQVLEAAVTALGKVGTEAAYRLAMDILDDDSRWMIHREAAGSLIELNEPKAISCLLSILDQERDSRSVEYILKALWNSERPEVRVKIRTLALENSDVGIRREAIETLGWKPWPDDFETLVKALNDQDAFCRRNAATALGNLGSLEAVKPLLGRISKEGASGDPCSSYVLERAIESLGKLRSEEALGPLIVMLSNGGEYEGLREEVIKSLSRIGDPRACGAIRQRLIASSDLDEKAECVDAVRGLQDTSAIPLLIGLLTECIASDWQYHLAVRTLDALRDLTGEHFGYLNFTEHRPGAEAAANERVMRRWIEWWDQEVSRSTGSK